MNKPLATILTLSSLVAVAAVLASSPARAALPPGYVNYQGVLRDASDTPLDGTYDMEFRFFQGDPGGDPIMIDSHTSAGTGAVVVTNGLFNVQLGAGVLTDGPGAGSYLDLGAVFRDFWPVYLEVKVGTETLSPRVLVVSAPYALNSYTLAGYNANHYIDTSTATQTKASQLTLDASTASSGYGVQALGPDAGLYAKDSNGAGYGYLGTGDWGVRGFGLYPAGAGGYFKDIGHSGEAQLAIGDSGIVGYGLYAGAIFRNGTSSSYTDEAYAAYGGFGVQGSGNVGGGFFRDRENPSSYAYLGYGSRGIEAYGNNGGYFVGSGGTGVVGVGGLDGGSFSTTLGSGTGVIGVGGQTGAYGRGTNWGGYFEGTVNLGVEGSGPAAGALFRDSNQSGRAYVGRGNNGIDAYGDFSGGSFTNTAHATEAYIANDTEAAYFANSANGTAVWLAYQDEINGPEGMQVIGIDSGGEFYAGNGNVTFVATNSDSKVLGLGSNDFIQNHPSDKNKVIVYSAPEGDEIATYTRGTARLVGGVARVSLGPTFAWVTNPDIGLTAYLTPRGTAVPLAVDSLTPSELVVRGPDIGGASDVVFDYVVYGLRIGFEEKSVVRERTWEAKIPSMDFHARLYENHPELRGFNALERFKQMRDAVGTSGVLDLSASKRLRDAIGEFDPAVDALPLRRPDDLHQRASAASQSSAIAPAGASESAKQPSTVPDSPTRSASVVDPMTGRCSMVASGTTVTITESVEPGDVVANDPSHPGRMRRAETQADPGVVGIVSGDPGIVWSDLATIALSGSVVLCKVDASYGAIRPNDLLVASPTAGHAMRSAESPGQGTVVGKALEPLDSGMGLITVLVMSR